MRAWGGVGFALLWLGLAAGCDRGAIAETPVVLTEPSAVEAPLRDRAAESPKAPERPDREGLLIGEFRLAEEPVVDGDTIRVEGVEGSIRLLSIDTEEKLRSKANRAAAERDYAAYLEKKRGNAIRPQKAETPMGDRATAFAEAFFEGVDVVRLERDDPKKMRGQYGRMLAYVFAKKNGRWTSYNVECVRSGMSPYFTKYGYSHRFHNQLTHAEAEAREAQRGIWSPDAKGYGDYDERKAWWNARAEFIRAFEHEANARDDYVHLSHWDAEERLEEKLGEEVTVLGTIGQIKTFKGLVRVTLSGPNRSRFPIIFRDRALFQESGMARYAGEPVTVRGFVERYEKKDYRTLQIVVTQLGQARFPSLPWPEEETDSKPGR